VPRHFGDAVRNLKLAANFFRQDEILQFILSKFAWVCREKKLVSFRVPRAKKFENHWFRKWLAKSRRSLNKFLTF
jgi:hypothetical protein